MIKFITSFLSLLWVLLAGTPTVKNDLRKQPTRDDAIRNLNFWIQKNFYIIALAAIAICLIIFVIVCWLIVGVSAVESGTVYNHMNSII